MSKTKATIYLALIFIAGGVAGAALATKFAPKMARHGPPREHRPEDIKRHIFGMMTTRLKLRPEQVTEIEPIFMTGFNEVRGIQEKSLTEVEQAVRRNHDKIAQRLDPDQKEALIKMDAEREEFFRKHQGGPHGPPRPPAEKSQ